MLNTGEKRTWTCGASAHVEILSDAGNSFGFQTEPTLSSRELTTARSSGRHEGWLRSFRLELWQDPSPRQYLKAQSLKLSRANRLSSSRWVIHAERRG